MPWSFALPYRAVPKLVLPIAAALAMLITLPASAQWMWRDKEGRVTASDLPPPRDVADKDILQRPAGLVRRVAAAARPASAPASAAAPARTALDSELEARRRAAEQEQSAKAKVEADKLAAQQRENCGRARSQLTALESGQRIARFTDRGEREILDDKGRADEVRRARQVISSDCR